MIFIVLVMVKIGRKKFRIFKKCYKCNYMKEDIDIDNREITVYCDNGKSINKIF